MLVEGDEGYKAAKQFMKLLMPSHARRVKQYADPVSLYQRYGCLLYTSDAADERSSVDLGGRRIIKKKTEEAPRGCDISKCRKIE